MTVRKAVAGWDALVAQPGLLKFERVGSQTELQVPRTVEIGPDIVQILFEVPQRKRHVAILQRLIGKHEVVSG
jgi:hypothetical protein